MVTPVEIKLYVSRIPISATHKKIEDLFSKLGNCTCEFNREKGEAWVTFYDGDAALKALRGKHKLRGRYLKIRLGNRDDPAVVEALTEAAVEYDHAELKKNMPDMDHVKARQDPSTAPLSAFQTTASERESHFNAVISRPGSGSWTT